MKAAYVILLLVIAILLAGCSTRSTDVIVGTWQSDAQGDLQFTFYENGTYVGLYKIDSAYYEAGNGTWKPLNNSGYLMMGPDSFIKQLKYMNGKLYSVDDTNNSLSRVYR
jgi:hypothetical protein